VSELCQDPSEAEEDVPEHSFRAIYEAYVGSIYRFIYRHVGNREEAEDLTAQVFAKAVTGLDIARPPAVIQGWLFQVARTTITDHWRATGQMRARSLDELMEAGWEGPAAMDGVKEESMAAAAQVEAILARLPERYREVLRCRFLLRMSIKETAQHLGLTESNVKILQLRSLKRAATLQREHIVEVPADGEL
jgi:RNA polymerase sigma factor (sigma-70 family)